METRAFEADVGAAHIASVGRPANRHKAETDEPKKHPGTLLAMEGIVRRSPSPQDPIGGRWAPDTQLPQHP